MLIIIALVLILICISLGTYIYINVTYNKYKKIKIKSNLSGFEVSRKIIDNYDLNNVYITETKEYFISQYDSNRKVIRLVTNVFDGDNLVSTGISAVESGYAIIDKNNNNNNIYNIRKIVDPFIKILLITSYIIIVIGILFGHMNTLISGVSIDYLILIFYILTYSVEKEAKKNAIKELAINKIVTKKELSYVEKIINATILSNIASIIFPIVELIKKIIEFGKSN